MTAVDTFVGLPLDQSIADTVWDSGGLTWDVNTYLASDGNNGVKVKNLPGGSQILANVLPAAGYTGISARFKPAAGKPTDNRYFSLTMHSDGSSGSIYGLNGIAVRVGEYNTLQCVNLGTGESTEATGVVPTVGSEYEAEIRWLSGRDYIAKLYSVTAGVRGASPLFTTPTLTIGTARPASARMTQLYNSPSAVESTFTRFEAFDPPAADTTGPVLSAPTATATSSTTATGTVATDEAGGPLYSLVSANATETSATIIASGASQSVTATGTQTVFVTGLTAGSTRHIHYVQKDAAGNIGNVVSSASFTTPAPDTVGPTWPNGAAITPGAVTSSSVSGSYPAATDNVDTTGYQKSRDNGATWEENGTGLNFSFNGLTGGTTYPIWIRAKDAAGNFSVPLQLNMTTTASATGSLTTEVMIDGAPRASQAFTGTWFLGGVIGTTPGAATHFSGTTLASGAATVPNLPKGDGYAMLKFLDTGDGEGIYYQKGTVA